MSSRLHRNELKTVRSLMSMSLRAVVAEALPVDLERVADEAHLRDDLGMTAAGAERLRNLIADTFDGMHIDPAQHPTVGDLMTTVVLSELPDIPD